MFELIVVCIFSARSPCNEVTLQNTSDDVVQVIAGITTDFLQRSSIESSPEEIKLFVQGHMARNQVAIREGVDSMTMVLPPSMNNRPERMKLVLKFNPLTASQHKLLVPTDFNAVLVPGLN